MKYDVLVVGGGAAGLTAAAYAARAGKTVALFEKNKELGGLVQSVNRGGFVFDMGLRAIENAGIILPMAAELGLPLKYVRSRVSVGIADRIISIASKESLAEYGRLLESFYPESRNDIAAILELIDKIMKDMDVLYGIDNPLFKDLKKDYSYIFRTLLPWSIKFLITIGRINRLNTPIEEYLAGLTANVSLRGIIGQHFFKYTPAFFAMSYFSVYLDYLYPEGGTGTLMKLLAEYGEAQGVSIRKNCRIVKVKPYANTVVGEDGAEHSYGALIWAADLNSLFAAVDASGLSDLKAKRTIDVRREELKRSNSGDSVFSVFLSVTEPPEYFGKKSEGHFFYTPDPRGMGDLHTRGLQDLLKNTDRFENAVQGVKDYVRRFLSLNTFEISIPVLKDPLMAPVGKTGLIVSCLIDYTLVKKVREDGWYEEFKEFVIGEIIRVLSHTVYPGLEGKILDHFATTPLTIEDYTGNTGGAITGWAFGPGKVPVIHQMQQVAKSVLTPMKGVYAAGQWAYSPSGLPIAILTGKLAAKRAVKNAMGSRRISKRIFLVLFLLAVTLPLRPQEPEPALPSATAAETEPQAFFSSRTLLAVTNPEYLVSPGDVYTLRYNREPAAVTQYLIVESEMTVDLLVFGKEDVANLTFSEFRKRVEKKVRTAYPNSHPQVTFRSTGVFEVQLKGEVIRTGYKLAWGLTRLCEIVREDLTPYSSVRNIQIISAKGRSRFYDLYRASRAGEEDQDPFVRPGDTIILSKYSRQVELDGEVERPENYQLLPGENLQKAILGYGSGPTAAADLSRVELRQSDPVTKIEEIKYIDITKGYDPEIVLQNGDSIYVPSKTELLPIIYFEGAIVLDGGNPLETLVIYRQKHTLRRGETLYTALRSVVLSPQADLPACYIKREDQKIFVDLDDYLYKYDPKKVVVLQPLDCIVIPYFRF